jgi:UDP-glucose 4-epimerase
MSVILVTGASGAIGTAVCAHLERSGLSVIRLDMQEGHGCDIVADLGDEKAARQKLRHCEFSGVIHLAAVSRAADAEKNPSLCFRSNVRAFAWLIDELLHRPRRPWLVFASSREVYGQAATLPATEETPLQPMNVYGHSKVVGETLCSMARHCGLRTLVLRLTNVYGWAHDYPSRVIPAYVRAALRNEELRVEGRDHLFDFLHVQDVARAFELAVRAMQSGAPVPSPLQIVSNTGISLADLAETIIGEIGSGNITQYPEQRYAVRQFRGSFAAAQQALGWQPEITLEEGLSLFIHDMRRPAASAPTLSLLNGNTA